MPETATPLAASPAPSLEAVLRQCALPFFLFSLVLTALLTLSVLFLLPLLTTVEVGGTSLTGADVHGYQLRLAADITTAETERDHAVLPLDEPQYDALRVERQSLPSLLELRVEILRAAGALVPEKDAARIRTMDLDATHRTLRLTGDIRNVGPRSMTILAQWTEELSRLPFVASVTQPLFLRLDEPGIGMHSPFDILLTLR